MAAPSPTPYPTTGNAKVDSYRCNNAAPTMTPVAVPDALPGTTSNQVWVPYYECAVTHWTLESPAPIVSPVVNNTTNNYPSTAPAPAATPYAGGYTPQDPGNWTDIGPWFATLLVAVVLGPYCLMTFLRWIREVFSNV